MKNKIINRSVIAPTSIRCSCGKTVAKAISSGSFEVKCSCGNTISVFARSRLRCPECGNVEADGEVHPNCDWVHGRRGWRQLGVYDD